MPHRILLWNSETREELRESLRSRILGAIRLRKESQDEILDAYREAYIDEDYPKDERDAFVRFAADEIERAAARQVAESAAWPEDTDCDRLDRVEASSKYAESVK